MSEEKKGKHIIRLATMDDLSEILEIYQRSRLRMIKDGNPDQWGNHYPPLELLKSDVEKNRLYVLFREKEVYGVFYFAIEEDRTYQSIKGSWLDESEYGVIHRIAAKEGHRGIFSECLRFCDEKISHLRIDTHRDNLRMQRVLEKNGFHFCGIIYVEDGSERLAYEK